AGVIVETHDYEPYGQEIGSPPCPSASLIHYAGQERDYPTSDCSDAVDSMHFRSYGALIGRFYKPDNVMGNVYDPQSWNLYSYVEGRPTGFNDPTGHGRGDGLAYTAQVGQFSYDEAIGGYSWSAATTMTVYAGNTTSVYSLADGSDPANPLIGPDPVFLASTSVSRGEELPTPYHSEGASYWPGVMPAGNTANIWQMRASMIPDFLSKFQLIPLQVIYSSIVIGYMRTLIDFPSEAFYRDLVPGTGGDGASPSGGRGGYYTMVVSTIFRVDGDYLRSWMALEPQMNSATPQAMYNAQPNVFIQDWSDARRSLAPGSLFLGLFEGQ
ncbi:MAG: RHS repeat-associated core domain-containing protein, partial [Acidobacteriota bacterium]